MKLTGDIRRDFDRVTAENTQLKDRILGYQEQIHDLRRSLSKVQKAKDSQKAAYEGQLAEKDIIIKELKNRLEHELALKGHDGTNTGIPTSQTPINKKKVIPNSGRNTGKKKGGQAAPCEGYIAKLQHRASSALDPFFLRIPDKSIIIMQKPDEPLCPSGQVDMFTFIHTVNSNRTCTK